MTLNEKLEQKLRPHVDRVMTGSPNDYDYLPAVLFSGIDSTDKLFILIKNEFSLSKKLTQDNNTEILRKIGNLGNEINAISKLQSLELMKHEFELIEKLRKDLENKIIQKVDSAHSENILMSEKIIKQQKINISINIFIAIVTVTTIVFLK